MDTKNALLVFFIVTTVFFASLTVDEYAHAPATNSSTISSVTAQTSCAYTTMPAEIDCPHFFNQDYTIAVSYEGPWGATYQGWLGAQASGQSVVYGSFYGNSSGTETINVSGWSTGGITVCAEAQKLDSSGSTLVVSILPTNVTNQTSLAYGTTMACISDVIV